AGEARRQDLQPARRLRSSPGALGPAAAPRVLRLGEARGRRRARGPCGPRKGVRRRLRAAAGVRKSPMDVLLANPRGFCAGAVRAEAESRGLKVFDATCPLVTKVHVEVAKMLKAGYEIVMIGHPGHPEAEGTMGQAERAMYLVETLEDVAGLVPRNPAKLAYV